MPRPRKNKEVDRTDEIRAFNMEKTMEEYVRVSEALKDPNCENWDHLIQMQLKLCREVINQELTPEQKLEMYLDGRADELLPDGNGKDEICGRVLPTEEEVAVGMYPDRSVYFFNPFTCGVYHFYTLDGKFNYIGSSAYIEYALHSHFCRWRSERESPDIERKKKFNGLKPVRYIMDNHPGQLRFRIIEKVPYSLLDAAVRNQRAKNKAMWQYDISSKAHWDPDKYEAGLYNY